MSSLARKERRIEAKALKKGKPKPILNLHIARKKDRKFGIGALYNQKAEVTIIPSWED